MALHEIHWNPSARAMVLVRNHEMDSECGWVGGYIPSDLSKKDRVKLAGNAVTPPVMTAIAERIMVALGAAS